MSLTTSKDSAPQMGDLYALAKEDYHVLEGLIAENKNLITDLDANKRGLIHWAALGGRCMLITHLVSHPECECDRPDDTDTTPLILATLAGHFDVVKLLVTKGANINQQNTEGHSAIQYACSKGWKPIVDYLIERGVNLNIMDKRKETVLHRAACLGREEILATLLANLPDKTVINGQNSEGNTALHLACEDEQTACATMLVEHGADITVENREKQTPLDLCKPGLRRQIKTIRNITD